jgi:hypothetical protein
MCTECFLQVRPQKEKSCCCPFCNNPKLYVAVAKKLDADQLQERQAEEQRVIEQRIQKQHIHEAEEKQRMRFNDDEALIRQSSMTEEDRRAIEREMRAQHTHPLALQMQAEADKRRVQNEQDYYKTHSGNIREAALLRAARIGSRGDSSSSRRSGNGNSRRNWNDIVSAFEQGGGEQVNSLDDLVVLEAAILLSMEEAARRGVEGTSETNKFNASQHARDGFPLVQQLLTARTNSHHRLGGRGFQGLTENEQVAMAIALSMQESISESSDSTSADNNKNTDVSDDTVAVEKDERIEQPEETEQFKPTHNILDEMNHFTSCNIVEEAAAMPQPSLFDESDSRISGMNFDDSDKKMTAVDFDESDQKMPAIDFNDSDCKLAASDLDVTNLNESGR